MPKLTIEHAHSLEPQLARERLDALNARLASKYGIEAQWKSETEATFKRIGASGGIVCHPGRVVITLDLSFALTPMKGRIENRIRQELAKSLESK